MTPEEYQTEISAIEKRAESERKVLDKKYASLNNHIQPGEIVTDHMGSVLVEEIKFYRGTGLPMCVYYGKILNKDGSVTKKKVNKRAVYQSNLVKSGLALDKDNL
jgi:hypothetical protein